MVVAHSPRPPPVPVIEVSCPSHYARLLRRALSPCPADGRLERDFHASTVQLALVIQATEDLGADDFESWEGRKDTAYLVFLLLICGMLPFARGKRTMIGPEKRIRREAAAAGQDDFNEVSNVYLDYGFGIEQLESVI